MHGHTGRGSYLLFFTLLAAAVLSLPHSATAATWVVNPAGTEDATTIQGGIDLASPSDTVLVRAGVYVETDITFGGIDIVVRSESGPLSTTVDLAGGFRGFIFAAGETSAARLEGFTIRNGVGVSIPGFGAALAITDSSPTIADCVISGMTHSSPGGVVFVSGALAAPAFEGCTITANRSTGIGPPALTISDANPTFDRTIIWGNDCGPGGEYEVSSGTATFTCSIVDTVDVNTAGSSFDGNTTFSDPMFCGPEPCASTPTPFGLYTLQSASPAAPGNSLCGLLIDALGVECTGVVDWTGDGNGTTWEDPDNWSTDQTPGVGEHARIIEDGTYTVSFNANSSIFRLTVGGGTGTQTLSIDANVLTISDGVHNVGEIFVATGATIDVTGSLDPFDNLVGAQVTLDDGTLSGLATFANRGAAITTGSATSTLALPVDNTGDVQTQAGTLSVTSPFDHSGTLSVSAGATLTLDALLTSNDGATIDVTGNVGGSSTLQNAGVLSKLGGSTSTFAATLANQAGTGDVQIDAGTLRLLSPASNAGLVDIALGATLDLAAPLTSASGATITVVGDIIGASVLQNAGLLTKAGGGTTVLSATLVNQAPTGDVQITAGTLQSLATLTNASTMNVASGATLELGAPLANAGSGDFGLVGDVTGSQPFQNQGAFSMDGPATSLMSPPFFNQPGGDVDINTGTLDVLSAFDNLASVTVLGGASINLQAELANGMSGVLVLDATAAISGVDTLRNTGTLTKSGAGTAPITAPVVNGLTPASGARGRIDVDEGKLSADVIENYGVITTATGTELEVASVFNHRDNAVIQGTGTYDATVASFTIAGVVSPGSSPGTMRIEGSFIQEETASILFDINGTTAGTDYDQIVIAGPTSFGGAANVRLDEGFLPQLSDQFDVIVEDNTAGRLASGGGGFECFSGLELPGGLLLDPLTVGNDFSFVVIDSISTNTSPVAVDDAATAAGTEILTVLDNDTDADGDSLLVVSLVTDGTDGIVFIDVGDTTITYVPTVIGTDTFQYFVTDCNGGLDSATVTVEVVAVATPDQSPAAAIPPAVILKAPRPNPAAGVVTIDFALPASGDVTLRVYDVHGRLVRTLLDDPLPAGPHAARWEDASREIASGVYYVVLETIEAREVRKVIRLQ